MTTNNELLPCPFCQCEMHIDPVARDWWLAQSYVGQVLAVLIPSHWMPLPAFPSRRIEGE